MARLSKGQLNRASEVMGNISVAWFTAGAITPLFAPPVILIDFTARFGVSLVLFGFFFSLSIKLAKGVKK